MNTPPILKYLFTLCLLVGFFPLSHAQNIGKAYPSLRIVSQKGNGNQAQYGLAKGGKTYQLEIKKVSKRQVTFTVKNGGNTLASGQFYGASGTGKTIQIDQTRKGMLDILQFATDRVQSQKEGLVLAKSNNQLLNCVISCSGDLLKEDIAEDNARTQVAFYSNNGDTCSGYVPCSQEALADYDECVQSCLEEKATNNNRN